MDGFGSITPQEWEEAERAALEYCKERGTTPEELRQRELKAAISSELTLVANLQWGRANPEKAARIEEKWRLRWERCDSGWKEELGARVVSLPEGCYEENGVIYQYTETP